MWNFGARVTQDVCSRSRKRPLPPVAIATFAVALLALPQLCACEDSNENENLLLTLAPTAEGRMGYIQVTGTVSVTPAIPRGARVVFGMTDGRPTAAGVFDESVAGNARAETQTVALRVVNMRAGEAYSFYVGVDLNGDGSIGSGDLGGYYDGSTVLPFTEPSSARLIAIRQNMTDLNFGIGQIK